MGDGETDDTLAIQSTLNAAHDGEGNNEVFIPDGTYMMNLTTFSWRALLVPANITIQMTSGATLKAFPCNLQNYALMYISKPNITIIGEQGAQLVGERDGHYGVGGEWGMGFYLNGATDLLIDGLEISEFWGDGIYVTGNTKRAVLQNLVANHNRRQGMSIVYGNDMLIKDCVFSNTAGTDPEAGIDIEPNQDQYASNITILGCNFYNNSGSGLQLGSWLDEILVWNISVLCNTFSHNVYSAFYADKTSGVLLSNNYIISNPYGVATAESAIDFIVTGNVIVNTTSWAIVLDGSSEIEITDNVICSLYYGIEIYATTYCTVTGNLIFNAEYPIFENDVLEGNIVTGNNATDSACDDEYFQLPDFCDAYISDSAPKIGSIGLLWIILYIMCAL